MKKHVAEALKLKGWFDAKYQGKRCGRLHQDIQETTRISGAPWQRNRGIAPVPGTLRQCEGRMNVSLVELQGRYKQTKRGRPFQFYGRVCVQATCNVCRQWWRSEIFDEPRDDGPHDESEIPF